MLVEFQRVNQYGDVGSPPRKIGINPEAVGAVHDSMQHPGVSIVRLYDGRGYLVKGSYSEVWSALHGTEPEPADQDQGLRLVKDEPMTLEGSEVEEDAED